MKKYISKTYSLGKNKYLLELDKSLLKEERKFIITANPETLMIGKRTPQFNDILLDEETTIIPDGIGVVKGAKILGVNIKERIPGVEIVEHLLAKANELSKSVYIYGSSEATINTLRFKLADSYPKIKVLGIKNGYDNDPDEIMKEAIKAKPDIVLVALGIPKQELLIAKYFKGAKKGIFIGVGGSLDVISGIKKRAPKLFVKTNLEWLYRLICEPSRIKRFYNSNVKFIFEIKKEK